MKKRKLYISPYIDVSLIEDDNDLLAGSPPVDPNTGPKFEDGEEDDNSRQSKSSNFIWDTDGWEI